MATGTRTGAPPAPPRPATAANVVRFERPAPSGRRIGIYGPGGIGKTSLAAMAPGPVAFFDLDDALGNMRGEDIPHGADLRVASGIGAWASLLNALDSSGWDEIKTIVIDSGSEAEILAVRHVLATIPNDKGAPVKRIEEYGWGKGYQFVYDTFQELLGALNAHRQDGRNVVIVMHDCTANVPNPNGEDYIRYEPRLQSPPSGKGSIRHRVREWLDDLFFVGYDLIVKDGKADGKGTRTIYPTEQPHAMAKSRRLADPIGYEQGSDYLWRLLFANEGNENVS